MNARAIEEVNRELKPGEQILWAGRPRSGLRFMPGDFYLIPFSLLYSFAVLRLFAEIPQLDSPAVAILFATVFSGVGFYFLIGRYLIDAFRRANSYYGVTNSRVMSIHYTFLLGRVVNAYTLAKLHPINFTQHADNSGTISFGEHWHWFHRRTWLDIHCKPPLFDRIDDARSVYHTVMNAQQPLEKHSTLVSPSPPR